jgi:hypothetical protein
LVIDTLIAETNAGSVRWLNSFQQQPWNKQLLKDGELYDSLLPLRGYSVEELIEKKAQEKADQLEKERIIQEMKLKEEELARKRAEEWLKENFESVKNGTVSLLEKANGTAILTPRAEKAMPGTVMNRTLLEVSGGEVVSKSSLLSSMAVMNRTVNAGQEDVEPSTTKTKASLKILTLDDGTLVTPDENLVISRRTQETTASRLLERDETTDKEVGDSSDSTTNLLQWGKIGAKTPNFEDSINVGNGFPRNFYDIEDDDVHDDVDDDTDFDPFEIEWWDEVGEDGKEMRLSQLLADEGMYSFCDCVCLK